MKCIDCGAVLEIVGLTMKCPDCKFESTIAYRELMYRRKRHLPNVKVDGNYFNEVQEYIDAHGNIKSYSYMVKHAFELAYGIKNPTV